MDHDVLRLMYDVSLRVRVLKAWENAHAPYAPQFTERELLALEFMEQFSTGAPVTETVLADVFGLATSSASDLVRKLVAKDTIDKGSDDVDARQRPLTLTKKGREILDKIKANSAERYDYLLAGLNATQQKAMAEVLGQMKTNVMRQLARRFNRSL